MKKSSRFRDKYSFQLKDSDKEKINPKSETIEHDAYTIQELLSKFTNASGYPVQKRGTYEKDADHNSEIRMDAPDFDLTDETLLKNEAQITIDQVITENKQVELERAKQQEEEIFQKKLKDHQRKEGGRKATPGDEADLPSKKSTAKNKTEE